MLTPAKYECKSIDLMYILAREVLNWDTVWVMFTPNPVGDWGKNIQWQIFTDTVIVIYALNWHYRNHANPMKTVKHIDNAIPYS